MARQQRVGAVRWPATRTLWTVVAVAAAVFATVLLLQWRWLATSQPLKNGSGSGAMAVADALRGESSDGAAEAARGGGGGGGHGVVHAAVALETVEIDGAGRVAVEQWLIARQQLQRRRRVQDGLAESERRELRRVAGERERALAQRDVELGGRNAAIRERLLAELAVPRGAVTVAAVDAWRAAQSAAVARDRGGVWAAAASIDVAVAFEALGGARLAGGAVGDDTATALQQHSQCVLYGSRLLRDLMPRPVCRAEAAAPCGVLELRPNGRLGNQLCAYSVARLLGDDMGGWAVSVQGTYYRSFADAAPYVVVGARVLDEHNVLVPGDYGAGGDGGVCAHNGTLTGRRVWEDGVFADVRRGYHGSALEYARIAATCRTPAVVELHNRIFARYEFFRGRLQALRALYTWDVAPLPPAVDAAALLDSTTVVIHIRAGDLADAEHPIANQAMIDEDFIAAVLNSHGLPSPPPPPRSRTVYVTTDSRDHPLVAHVVATYGAVVSDGNYLTDFKLLTQAPVLVLSDSTYSWMASLLNTRAHTVHYPVLGIFVPGSSGHNMIVDDDARYVYHWLANDHADEPLPRAHRRYHMSASAFTAAFCTRFPNRDGCPCVAVGDNAGF